MIQHFYTDTGQTVPTVTEEQMREIDRIAMEEGGPNLFQMMENAGRNLAMLAINMLGESWRQATVVILAGSGGNGGGGICAGRHLANRNVHISLLLATPAKLGDVPIQQRDIFRQTTGNEVGSVDNLKPDLIIDALIGYSLHSAPRPRTADLIDWCNASSALTLSLDLPSGVNATTGERPGAFVKPDSTLTLALPKSGLLPEICGDLYLGDIGIPESVYRRLGIDFRWSPDRRYVVPLLSER